MLVHSKRCCSRNRLRHVNWPVILIFPQKNKKSTSSYPLLQSNRWIIQNQNENVPQSCQLYNDWLVYIMASGGSSFGGQTVFEASWVTSKISLHINVWVPAFKQQKLVWKDLWVAEEKVLCDSNIIHLVHYNIQATTGEEEEVSEGFDI